MRNAVEMRKYADECFDNQTEIARLWARKIVEVDIAPIVEEFAEKGCYSCLMKFHVSALDDFQHHALYELLDDLGYEIAFTLSSIKISW